MAMYAPILPVKHKTVSVPECFLSTGSESVSFVSLTLQTLMERAVVLGLGAQLESTSPALAELLSQYASILASQVSISLGFKMRNPEAEARVS